MLLSFLLTCGGQRWFWGQICRRPYGCALSLPLAQLLLPDDGARVGNLFCFGDSRASHCHLCWAWFLGTTTRFSSQNRWDKEMSQPNEEHYLGSCWLHLAFLFLVLFVGSGVDHQLLAPPWDGQNVVRRMFGCIRWKPAEEKQDLPIDYLFIFSSDEIFLLWRDDAQGVLLAGLGLGVNDISAQVHVHCPLRQRAGLKGDKTQHYRIGIVDS